MIEETPEEELARLRAENRRLRNAIAPRVGFPATWRLSPTETRILECLLAQDHASQAELVAIAGGGKTPLRTWFYRLRTKLPAGVEITTVYGDGYALTDEGRAVLEDAT